MTTEPEGGTAELLTALAQDVRAILQEELTRLRHEFGQTAAEGRRAAFLLGGAGLLGALAAGTSAAVLVRMLDGVLPRPWAVVVATGIFATGAAGLARQGLAELRRARQSLAARTPAG